VDPPLLQRVSGCRRIDTDPNYTAGAIGEVLLDRGVIPARVSALVAMSSG
jgi:hypothetical protein